MISSDQFLQCDVRLRQAKNDQEHRFGNLATNVCGDFLQLPPVEKHKGSRRSLAMPLDHFGRCEAEEPEGEKEETQDKSLAARMAEARQGFDLWRSITRVVCLTVNVRAPGVLSRLQAEMRAGKISDEMWDLYKDRLVKHDDPRLQDPALPFYKKDIHFIVHRHKIRAMRSLEYAKNYCRDHKLPLYVVQARDQVVRSEDASKLTDKVQAELLQRVNPDATKGLPSFLPLYRGMKLLISSKDCVRLGIVKGCPCKLEDIVFADEEDLGFHHVAGQPRELRFMPVSLLLRAENATWTLSSEDLPRGLPPTLDKRGLFQMRPTYGYLRAQVENEYITVRRTTFLATPADTITVYSAQGSTFDAVIADMQRPPNLDMDKHWLACYVMLSRATTLEGFLVLRLAKREELSHKPPKYLLDELDRLMKAEEKSLQELIDYINSLPMKVPAAITKLLQPAAIDEEAARVAKHRGAHSSTSRQLVSPPAEAPAKREDTPRAPAGTATAPQLASPPARVPAKRPLASTPTGAAAKRDDTPRTRPNASAKPAAEPQPASSPTSLPAKREERPRTPPPHAAAPTATDVAPSKRLCTKTPQTRAPKRGDSDPPLDDDAKRARTSATCNVWHCTQSKHLCPEDNVAGCSSCSKTCHKDNSSALCPFYNRARGALSWETDETQSQDTRMFRQELRGELRHMTQLQWSRQGRDPANPAKRLVKIDAAYYYLGFASGAGCNCLVESLRQCLDVSVNAQAVRNDLKQEFSTACGVNCHHSGSRCEQNCMKVYDKNYLSTDHWEAVIRLIGRHAAASSSTGFDTANLCLRVLELGSGDSSGVVLGNPNAEKTLTIAHENGNHFVPVLPCATTAQNERWLPW